MVCPLSPIPCLFPRPPPIPASPVPTTPSFLLAAAASFSSLSPASSKAKAKGRPTTGNRRSGCSSRSRRGERAHLSPTRGGAVPDHRVLESCIEPPRRRRAPTAAPRAPLAARALALATLPVESSSLAASTGSGWPRSTRLLLPRRLVDEATCKVGWVLIASRRKGKAAADEEVPSQGMKGHHLAPRLPSPAAMGKRLCTGMAAAVAALVVCSVLLPLAFLLGLHRTGHGSEERAAVIISTELGLRKHRHLDGGMRHKLLKLWGLKLL